MPPVFLCSCGLQSSGLAAGAGLPALDIEVLADPVFTGLVAAEEDALGEAGVATTAATGAVAFAGSRTTDL